MVSKYMAAQILTKSQPAPADWKDNYFKALMELETQERGWMEKQQHLFKAIVHLSDMLYGQESILDQRIEAFRDCFKRSPNDPEIESCIDGIVRAAMTRKGCAPAEQTVEDPTATDALAFRIAEIFEPVLDRIEFPMAFQSRVESVRNELKAVRHSQDLPRVANALSSLIEALQTQSKHELDESKIFLQKLTERLEFLQRGLLHTSESHAQTWSASEELQESIAADVLTLRSGVEKASGLDQLKSAIEHRLENIQSNVKRFVDSEQQRQRESDLTIAKMTKDIQSLTTESCGLKAKLKEADQQVRTDALTNIANRLAFDQRLAQEIAYWERYGGALSLIVLDVDHFKRINDTYGHATGDRVLKTIAAVLKAQIRETDLLARYGGEEFVLLLPNTAGQQAAMMADKLRIKVENNCNFHHQQEWVQITMSCGITEMRVGDTAQAFFERADRHLYQAKAAGRNRCIADPGLAL